jgi:acyl carrier protein
MRFSKKLSGEVAGTPLLRVEAALGKASMHYLLDHTVLDKHIAPSSLLLEAASACGDHFLVPNSGIIEITTIALSDSAFPAAVELGRAAQEQHLACTVDPMTGNIIMTTHGPGTSNNEARHMTGTFSTAIITSINSNEGKSNDVSKEVIEAVDDSTTELNEEEVSTVLASVVANAPAAVTAPNAAFASFLAQQHQHTGYWLHPTVAESSHQLALALQAVPNVAFVTAAVELCSIAAATLSTNDGAIATGCTLDSTKHASNWCTGPLGATMMSSVGTRFTSLASWSEMMRSSASVAAAFTTTIMPPFSSRATTFTTTTIPTAGGIADHASIVATLNEISVQILGEGIATDQPLMAAGLDSVGAVELKNAVSGAFGLELPSTVTFDYPTIDALAQYIASTSQSVTSSAATGAALVQDPAAAAAVHRTLMDIAAGILGGDVAPSQPFIEAGLDSVGSVELRNAVQSAFGMELPATVTFDYPTVDALASFVLSSTTNSTSSLGAYTNTAYLGNNSSPITGSPLSAITGWSGIAASTAEHAETTLSSRFFSAADLIRPVPFDRWDIERVNSVTSDIQGSGSLRMAAWAEGVALFDESAFRLSKSESLGMDPQCRILLEQSWEVLDTSTVIAQPHLWPNTGVYVGIVWTEYQVFQEGLKLPPSTASLTGSGLNFSVGRVSYTFGLQGPCVGMDTACSSSLVAIHMAHRGLHDGETTAAMAAGSNFILVSSTSVHLAQLGSLSSNGRSKTFDASADGYGRGEACVAMVLQKVGGVLEGQAPEVLLHGRFAERTW